MTIHDIITVVLAANALLTALIAWRFHVRIENLENNLEKAHYLLDTGPYARYRDTDRR